MKKYKENEDAREAYEREKRSNMQSTGKPRVGPKASITNETDVSGNTDTNTVETAPDFSSMFSNSGPADLAMARKMENSK